MTQDPGQNPYPGSNAPYPGTDPASQAPTGYGQYPTQPGYPAAAPAYPGSAAVDPGEPPKPLATAVKLMWVGAVLSLVAIAVGVTDASAPADEEMFPGMSPEQIESAVAIVKALSVVFGLIGTGLWVLNAIFNGKGRKWARILATVLGGIALIMTLTVLTAPQSTASLTLSIVQAVLALVIVVLLWRPESSRYYEAVSASRR